MSSPATASPAPPNTAPTPVVRSVTVVGAHALSQEEVVRAAVVAVGKASDEAAPLAARAVQSLYRDKGYVLARVIEAETGTDGTLRLTVSEGIIRRIRIRGNTRTRGTTVRSVLSLGPGDVYNEKRATVDRARLARLGIFADVSVAAQVPGDEEKPRTKNGTTSNNATPPANPAPPAPVPNDPAGSVPAPAPAPAPSPANPTTDPTAGGVTNPAPPATGGVGVVPTVPTTPVSPTAPPIPAEPLGPVEDLVGQVDLVVRVQERTTGNVAATVGYADGSGAVGFVDLSEDNVFGTAQRVALRWQRTTQGRVNDDGTVTTTGSRSAFEFSYDTPGLRPGSLAFGVDVYNKNTVFLPFFTGGQETLRTYERRRGARTRVGALLGSGVFGAYLTARRDNVGYDPLPDDLNVSASELANSDATVGAVGFQLTADGRDVSDNPGRGFRHSLSVEQAANGLFGGDRAFRSVTLDLRQYTPLNGFRSSDPKKGVPLLATRLLGGTLSGSVPLSEEYFLGGYELLRGYDLFSIRGERMVLATIEGRIPLSTGLQGVVFTDAGNAWMPSRRIGLRDLKASAGAGLRFLSPFGPIRLDVAYGSRLQTYVSLGQSF